MYVRCTAALRIAAHAKFAGPRHRNRGPVFVYALWMVRSKSPADCVLVDGFVCERRVSVLLEVIPSTPRGGQLKFKMSRRSHEGHRWQLIESDVSIGAARELVGVLFARESQRSHSVPPIEQRAFPASPSVMAALYWRVAKDAEL
ncbi:unnamed protein product, partial [Iphiclides podalirius]